MTVRGSALQTLRRAGLSLAAVALAGALCGCAGISENMSTAFADPAKYELWDCQQLEPERKNLASRAAELEGLMAKAETGVGGAMVAEMAYRNDYTAVRGQQKFAEEAWQRNKCQETAPAPAASAAKGARPPRRSGNSVH